MNTFITITHLDEYMAADYVCPNDVLVLRKIAGKYDDETIAVFSARGARLGYVANSTGTVARGTHSAGYIYRDFGEETTCTVRFRFEDTAIAELNTKEETPAETENANES